MNFEVILKDTAFRDTIQKDKELAHELNATLTEILNFKKELGSKGMRLFEKEAKGDTEAIARKFDEIRKNLDKIKSETVEVTSKTTAHTGAVKDTNTALTGTEGLMRSIAQLTGIAFGVAGVRRFASELIKITGEFEVQKMALTSMLQDADKADEIFTQLRANALESPYTFQDLTKYAKQLTAFNIPVDELVETEKRLADVSAALGVDMGRIILAYGQVKAAGVLKGTELRQFTEAGVPLLEQLAKQLEETEGRAISLSEVFSRISKKEIPFEMVEESFRRMTSEGGKFYNMQAVLVETLQGKIGKLRDVWQQALYDLGNSNSSILKGGVDAITALASHLETIINVLTPVIAGFGAYYGALALATVAEKALAGVQVVKALYGLVTGSKAAASALVTMGISAKAAAVGIGALVGVALSLLIRELARGTGEMDKFKKELDEVHKSARGNTSFDDEASKLKSLLKILEDSNKSYDERKAALTEIQRTVPDYHASLTAEGALINNNRIALDKYIEALNREAKAMGARDELSQLYNYQRTSQSEVDRLTELANTADANYKSMSGEAAVTQLYFRNKYNAEAEIERQKLAEINRRIDAINAELLKQDGFAGGLGDTAWGANPSDAFKPPVIDLEKVIEDADRQTEEILNASIKSVDKELDEWQKAMNRWDEFAKDIERKTGIKTGEGAAFKVSSLVVEKQNADSRVYKEFESHLKDIQTLYNSNAAAYENAKDKLVEWKKAQLSSNDASFREKLRGIAKDIVNEGLEGFDLTNWGDKSVSQIDEIRKALMRLDIPDSVKSMLTDDDLQVLSEAVTSIVNEKLDKTVDPERLKAIGKNAKMVAKEVISMANAFERLGNATDNGTLSTLGDALNEIGDIAESVSSYIAQSNWGGAAISLVATIVTKMFEDAANDAERLARAQEEAAENAIKFEDAIRSASLSRYDTIFGANDLGKFRKYVQLMDEYKKNMEEMRKELAEGPWSGLYREAGYINEDGSLNLERLFAANDAGLVTNERVQNLLKNYREAATAIDDTMESIFGQIASDAADQIVDSWWEAGKAALDYSDILEDVAKSYAKLMVQQVLFDTAFDEQAQAALRNAFSSGDAGAAMQIVADAMQRVEEMLPVAEQALQAFEPYRNLGGDTSSESNSMGAGIKSITEETASLLASYINAIRADVSVMRGLQEQGFEGISLIGQALPTLNDYLNQVAANTYDTAEASRAILSELQSVIGAPGTSGMVVRVANE